MLLARASAFLGASRLPPRAPPFLRAVSAAASSEVVASAREVAVAAARATGDEIRKGMGAEIAQTKANFRDLLTEVDGRVQSMVSQVGTGTDGQDPRLTTSTSG